LTIEHNNQPTNVDNSRTNITQNEIYSYEKIEENYLIKRGNGPEI